MMGRYFRSPKNTHTRRVAAAAKADHRVDNDIPVYVLPEDEPMRSGSYADVHRQRGHAAHSKPTRRLKHRRPPWKQDEAG